MVAINHDKVNGSKLYAYEWNYLANFLGEGYTAGLPNYIIFKSGSYYFARNGTTGILDYGGPDELGGVLGYIDATDVINACVAKSGSVHIESGTFPLLTPIEIMVNNVTLSMTPKTVLVNAYATDDAIKIGDSSHQVWNTVIDGGIITRAANGAHYGIHLYDAHEWVLKPMKINNFASGAICVDRSYYGDIIIPEMLGGVTTLIITGAQNAQSNHLYIKSWIRGATTNCVTITGWAPQNIIFDTCSFSDTKNGIVVYDGDNLIIRNCYFEALTEKNIYLYGNVYPLKNPHVIDNWFMIGTLSGAGGYGIYSDHIHEGIIRDNSVSCSTGSPCFVYTTANTSNLTCYPNFLDNTVYNDFTADTLRVNKEIDIPIMTADDGEGLVLAEGSWAFIAMAPNYVRLNMDNLGLITDVRLNAVIKKTTGGFVYLKLYNITNSADVAGSNLSGSSTGYNIEQSANCKAGFLTGEKDYKVMYYGTGSLGRIVLKVKTN